MMEDFEADVRRLEAEGEHGWIRAKDRLPEQQGEIVLVTDGYDMEAGWWDGTEWQTMTDHYINVSHWRAYTPLPEVPDDR
ncbi:MAG: DUF551 domain-containing protein [Christensenellales bacterium]